MPQADLETIESLLGDETVKESKKSSLHFALAVVLDAKGDYERAGRHLHDANRSRLSQDRMRARDHDPDAHSRFVDLTPAIVRETAQEVLNELAKRNGGRPRITDKMPDNYLYVGFIATLFPQATIIHCRRDVRDVAVSCWLVGFQSIRWASDQEHLARRIGDYRRLMAHRRRVLSGRMVKIDYETTVTDLETTARQIVDAAGLAWDPACLAFHENKRPIRTASLAQVRQPIYTRSVGRWKHYETALKDLFHALEDLGSDRSRRVA